jgi:hypothetical protein
MSVVMRPTVSMIASPDATQVENLPPRPGQRRRAHFTSAIFLVVVAAAVSSRQK